MYHIGDRIAHPMHGAGIIEDVVSQRVGGELRQYYLLRLTQSSMTMLVPCDACARIGVRRIVDAAGADAFLHALPSIPVEINANWNQRYRDNMLRIKSGDLLQVAAVVKSLMARDRVRGLSTGERKMLATARQILVSELMLAKDLPQEEAERLLDAGLGPGREN